MQRDGWQALALALVPAEKFRREVLGIGRRAAVAADQQLATAAQAIAEQAARTTYDRRQRGDAGELQLGAFTKARGDEGGRIHGFHKRQLTGRSIVAEDIAQPFQMLHVERAGDADDVEATRRWRALPEALQVMLRGQQQASTLGRRDGLGGAAKGGAAPTAHFDEYQFHTMAGDEVDLTTGYAVIAIKDVQALAGEVRSGKVLGHPSPAQMGRVIHGAFKAGNGIGTPPLNLAQPRPWR